jgi:molybdopterin-guanine dinucleotide biosynthesis protein A
MILQQCSAAILVGGESRRMGEPKAVLRLGGRTLAEHVAGAVSGSFAEIMVVGHAVLPDGMRAKYQLRVVPDVLGDRSSMNGVMSSIEGSGREWTAVLACDAPWPCIPLLQAMAAKADAGVRVVACESEVGQLQPFHALWHRSAAAELRNRAARGNVKLRDALSMMEVVRVPPETWRRYDAEGRFLHNLNTPEEFQAALRSGPRL